MKKLLGGRLVVVCTLICALSAIADAQAQRVLLIAREGSENLQLMLSKELVVMRSMIEEAGIRVSVASSSGQELRSGSLTVQPDLKLSDVDPSEYQGVIVACMAAGIPGTIPPEAVSTVRYLFDKGFPVAAQNGAVAILGAAGILTGKSYAMERAYVKDGRYAGTGVVADGKVFTSGTCPFMASTSRPDGTRELTAKFIQAVLDSGL